MLRPARLVPVFLIAVALLWFVGGFGPARDVTPGSPTTLLAAQADSHMKEHFTKVDEALEALIRGDLEAARAPAKWLAEHPAQGIPEKGGSQLAAMQTAAKRVLEAKDVRYATNAVATMAVTCGTCHRATGISPKLPEPPAPPKAEGMASHMLAHQQAVDYLYQGLVVPSDTLWKKGAELLKGSPLQKEQFPDDPKLTADIKAFEAKTHEYANMARNASDAKTRVGVYGELIAGCAECHSLHGRVWGPGVPKQ